MCMQFRPPSSNASRREARLRSRRIAQSGKGCRHCIACAEMGRMHVHHVRCRHPSCRDFDARRTREWTSACRPGATPTPLPSWCACFGGDYGERAVTSAAVREHHGHGEGLADSAMPRCGRVSTIERGGRRDRAPVPSRARTGNSVRGGNLARGQRCRALRWRVPRSDANEPVLEVNGEDLDCRVQAGVTREQFERRAPRAPGLFFPIDPGATRPSAAWRHPRVRHERRALRPRCARMCWADRRGADGRIVRTGGRARKSSAGYDLTRLFVGAKATARRDHRDPASPLRVAGGHRRGVCQFSRSGERGHNRDRRDAESASGGALELLDDVQMDACIRPLEARKVSKPSRRCSSSFMARQPACASTALRCKAIATSSVAARTSGPCSRGSQPAVESAARAYYAALALKPGTMGFATDACRSHLASRRLHPGDQGRIEKSGLTAPIWATSAMAIFTGHIVRSQRRRPA